MSQTLTYKGYDGSVFYSAEDRVLHGRILGIRDMVSFEGTDVVSLETSFHEAVDEYLAFCESEGKKPDVAFKGSFNVRLSQDLHQKAAIFAEQHKRKLNAVVSDALTDYLSRAS